MVGYVISWILWNSLPSTVWQCGTERKNQWKSFQLTGVKRRHGLVHWWPLKVMWALKREIFLKQFLSLMGFTPPKSNIDTKNDGFLNVFPFKYDSNMPILGIHVSFRGGYTCYKPLWIVRGYFCNIPWLETWAVAKTLVFCVQIYTEFIYIHIYLYTPHIFIWDLYLRYFSLVL